MPIFGQKIYEVFARAKRDEPLRHIGSVTADNEDLARAYACMTYDEETWIEMVLVPREAVIPVLEVEPHA